MALDPDSVPDRILGILVILNQLRASKGWPFGAPVRDLKAMINNTSLNSTFATRELPHDDPLVSRNPHVDHFDKLHGYLHQLQAQGHVSIDNEGVVHITGEGIALANGLVNDPRYKRLKEESTQALMMAKNWRGMTTVKKLESLAKKRSSDEWKKVGGVSDKSLLKVSPPGGSPGAPSADPGLDVEALIRESAHRIDRKLFQERRICPSGTRQIEFTKDVAREIEKLPIPDRPVIVVFGKCVEAERLLVDWAIHVKFTDSKPEEPPIIVRANELTIDYGDRLQNHHLKVVGTPYMTKDGELEIDAVELFDAGVRYY